MDSIDIFAVWGFCPPPPPHATTFWFISSFSNTSLEKAEQNNLVILPFPQTKQKALDMKALWETLSKWQDMVEVGGDYL